jgi:hypothetical protein
MNFKNFLKLENLIFILGVLFSILTIVFLLYKTFYSSDKKYYVINIIIVLLFLLFLLSALKFEYDLKINFSLLLVTMFVCCYAFETYLVFSKDRMYLKKQVKLSKNFDVHFDTRTKFEVIEDLREEGIKAYPNIRPRNLIHLNELSNSNGRIYPLGGIASITTCYDNELGYFPIVELDEHGFNNPKGLYKKNDIDIVLIGDSNTEGSIINSNENYSSILRSRGFNVINLAKGGSGILIEFATLVEYARILKPKIVLWCYSPNDYSDYLGEEKSLILSAYLRKEQFSQNLISRQTEIDSILIKYIEYEEQKIKNNFFLKTIIKLYYLRSMLFHKPSLKAIGYNQEKMIQVSNDFKKILKRSKEIVSEWDGELYFVHVPFYSECTTGEKKVYNYDYFENVLSIPTELEIPVIDLYEKVCAEHPDPASLFPFRSAGHWNSNGHLLIADVIRKRLESDGIIPSN